jgi:hypothetical protein
MTISLSPTEPLTQVVFVFNYFQLRFEDEVFSIFNLAVLEKEGTCLRQGEAGFCDALVGLIGQSATELPDGEDDALRMAFSGGVVLRVLASDDAIRGPEAWTFLNHEGVMVVEQNR